MTNFEAGDRLLQEAREYRLDLETAFGRGSWNVVIRPAQEVAELALKAAPKTMGIEYPKEHDVGRVFADGCRARGLSVEPGDLETVREISTRLARDRQPAFYMERLDAREDAVAARQGADRVLALVERLVEQMRGPRP